jgi:peptidoglycan/LPS O-acetylase OafA/YrhL
VPVGEFGIALFFMISGFVIFMTLERCHGAADFIVQRLSRLYPTYWAALLVTVVLWTACEPGYRFWARAFAWNVTMLHDHAGFPHLDVVYWSLSVELGFYAVMLTAFLLGWLRRVEWFCAGWLVSATAVLATFRDIPHLVDLLLVLTYAHLFVSGIMFYRIHRQGWTLLRGGLLLGTPIVQGAHGLYATSFVLVFFALFALALGGWLRWATVDPMVWLGVISYPLYLIPRNSLPIIKMLNLAGMPPLLVMGMAVLVALIAADVLSRYIERPALRLLRERWISGSAPLPPRGRSRASEVHAR